MTMVDHDRPRDARDPGRRSGELSARELARWTWRQLTSMRTALILLLVLALAAVPGSVIPQSGVDALDVSRWKDQHPDLTPLYERLGLFSVYDSPWFSAIYILLMISLIGCIIPRTFVYLRNVRAEPPPAPRNLLRLPDHASYSSTGDVDEVLSHARTVLRSRGYRLRAAATDVDDHAVSAERGYLREVGNLVFHLSVIFVLVGFAVGSLWGYQGGVILVKGQQFANTSASYDDFDPGSLFAAEDFDPFLMSVEGFDVEWLTEGSAAGTARKFNAAVSYQEKVGAPEEGYDLRVNHPLSIGDTDVFLIGHGYAPVMTVRDGDGNVTYTGPTVFLPQDQTFLSFGVVKTASDDAGQVGFEGLLYPTFALIDGDPVTVWPDDLEPLVSMSVYTGDLGLDSGRPQSVYLLETQRADQVLKSDGAPYRLDLRLGETATLPDGLGTVSFDSVEPWVRIQISQSPGKLIALGGVVMALVGLLGSLFIRPRRIWVRARRAEGVTMVEVAALDRSGGGDVGEVLDSVVTELRGRPGEAFDAPPEQNPPDSAPDSDRGAR
ncbi:MAG: cytochrome c biogenesis protein ResB [Nocardioides sp.]